METSKQVEIIDGEYQSTILNPKCGLLSLADAIDAKLNEIQTLALIATSEGFESFNTDIKFHYLSLIAKQAREAEALFYNFRKNKN
jgi:hypothetical protein